MLLENSSILPFVSIKIISYLNQHKVKLTLKVVLSKDRVYKHLSDVTVILVFVLVFI